MLDQPNGREILEAVARLLREKLSPHLPPEVAFHARVAANAVDLVCREMDMGPALESESQQRLRPLLGHDGTAAALEAELCARIRDGSIDVTSPELIDHLMANTLAKMSVDQPSYASYRREIEERR